jgi:hypothetical protein
MPGQLHISMSKHRSSRITIFVTCLDRHPTWNRYSLACLISRQYYMLPVGSKFILMGLGPIQKSGPDIGPLKYSALGPNVIPINGSSVYPSIRSIIKSSVTFEGYARYWILGKIRGSVGCLSIYYQILGHAGDLLCQLHRHRQTPIKGEFHPHFQGIQFFLQFICFLQVI